MGKVLEIIIYNRLLSIVESRQGLSQRQFAFRRGKSTIEAISLVRGAAEEAISGIGAPTNYSAIINVDIKMLLTVRDGQI